VELVPLGRSSFCVQQAGFAERTGQKIVLQRQLASLGVKAPFKSTAGAASAALPAEHPFRTGKQLSLPRR